MAIETIVRQISRFPDLQIDVIVENRRQTQAMPPPPLFNQVCDELQKANQQRDSKAAHDVLVKLSVELVSVDDLYRSPSTKAKLDMKDLWRVLFLLRAVHTYSPHTPLLTSIWQSIGSLLKLAGIDRMKPLDRTFVDASVLAGQGGSAPLETVRATLSDLASSTKDSLAWEPLHVELVCFILLRLYQAAACCDDQEPALAVCSATVAALGAHLQRQQDDKIDAKKEVDMLVLMFYNAITWISSASAPRAAAATCKSILAALASQQIFLTFTASISYVDAAMRKLGKMWSEDSSWVDASVMGHLQQLLKHAIANISTPGLAEFSQTMASIAMVLCSKLLNQYPADCAALLAHALVALLAVHTHNPTLQKTIDKLSSELASLLLNGKEDLSRSIAVLHTCSRQVGSKDVLRAFQANLCLIITKKFTHKMSTLNTTDEKAAYLNQVMGTVVMDLLTSGGTGGASAKNATAMKDLISSYYAALYTASSATISHERLRKLVKDNAAVLTKCDGSLVDKVAALMLSSATVLQQLYARVKVDCVADGSMIKDCAHYSQIFHRAVIAFCSLADQIQSNVSSYLLQTAIIVNDWSKLSTFLHYQLQSSVEISNQLCNALGNNGSSLATTQLLCGWMQLISYCFDAYQQCSLWAGNSILSPDLAKIKGFIATCCELIHGSVGCCEMELLEAGYERANQTLITISAFFGQNESLYCLKSYLHLFYAKALFHHFRHIRLATKHTKQALYPHHSKFGIQYLFVWLESMLVLIDLLDFVGNGCEKALECIAEVEIACKHKLIPSVHNSALQLHLIRVLHRAGSSRAVELLLPILQDKALSLHGAAMSICARMAVDSGSGVYYASIDASKLHTTSHNSGTDISSFRALDQLWNLSCQGCDKLHDETISNTLDNYVSLLKQQSTVSFDVLRQSRRKLCWDTMVLHRSFSAPAKKNDVSELLDGPDALLLAYLLGATSCYTALELEQVHSEGKLDAGQAAKLPALCKTVMAATQGNCEALQEIRQRLANVLAILPPQSAICFLCIDHVRGFLLLGRYDESGFRIAQQPSEGIMNVLKDFHAVMENSNASMNHTNSAEQTKSMTKAETKAWWKLRDQVDNDISSLSERLESCFGDHLEMLVPPTAANRESEDCSEIDRLIAETSELDITVDDDCTVDYDGMKLPDLRVMAKDRGIDGYRTLRRPALTSALREYDSVHLHKLAPMTPVAKPAAKSSNASGKPVQFAEVKPPVGHTVLILDELLQALPFETMPSLRNLSCSRAPSLAMLLNMRGIERTNAGEEQAIVMEKSKGKKAGKKTSSKVDPDPLPNTSSKLKQLNPHKCWFAVDVDQNLSGCREAMETFLRPHIQQYGWRAVIGNVPGPELMSELNGWADWYVYCGHGGGSKVFSSLSGPMQHKAALLWGCSSGRLVSQGIYDPSGSVLRHLLDGSDLVAGNLWDVTDVDLNKLSIACIETALLNTTNGEEGLSLPQALQSARNACKLKHAVGSAAVIYGLPLSIANS